MLADETALPEDQCRKAVNVDIDKDGNLERRQGFTKILSAVDVHSLYSSENSRYILGCQKNSLGVFDLLNGISFTALDTMPEKFRTDWTSHHDRYYASNPAYHCRINKSTFTVSPFSVQLPDPLSITPTSSGGLREGTYTVAWSVTNSEGEESALSDEVQIEVPTGGGIAITGVPLWPGFNLRVYASQANGEELYRAIETPMIATSFSIGVTEMNAGGNQPATRFMQELPMGHFIESHGSRLFVAFEDTIAFSAPFRPHLWDPRHNFIQLSSTVTMLASIKGGIFISSFDEVKFLAGDDPEQFEVQDVDADPAFFGSAVVVPGAHFSGELLQYDEIVVWLSRSGHMAGLPDGRVFRLNPGQLDLPSYSSASATFAVKNGVKRVLIPVNSNRRTGTGVAIDSEIF